MSQVSINSLQRWAQETTKQEKATAFIDPLSTTPIYQQRVGELFCDTQPKFLQEEKFNNRIVVWQGKSWLLDVDALVINSDESMSDRTGVNKEIFAAAGPVLESACQAAGHCRTGNAVMTEGGSLFCSKVIHATGPKWDHRYQTAAEQALHSCYRQALGLAKEAGCRTLCLTTLYALRNSFPRDLAAHLALRTCRRFMEHFPAAFDLLVFCCNLEVDMKIYRKILPLYFPRNSEEEQLSIARLPENIGGEWGEPVIQERQIKITSSLSKSKTKLEDDQSVSEGIGQEKLLPASEAPKSCISRPGAMHSFTDMQEDLDTERLQLVSTKEDEVQDGSARFERYVQRSRREDLSDIARLNVMRIAKCNDGMRFVYIFGSQVPSCSIQLERLLLFFIKEMDRITFAGKSKQVYTIFYAHTGLAEESTEQFEWLKEVFSVTESRYHTGLAAFYVLHPPILFKASLWAFAIMQSDRVCKKMKYIDSLEELHGYVRKDDLEFPDYVLESDRQLNMSIWDSFLSFKDELGKETKDWGFFS